MKEERFAFLSNFAQTTSDNPTRALSQSDEYRRDSLPGRLATTKERKICESRLITKKEQLSGDSHEITERHNEAIVLHCDQTVSSGDCLTFRFTHYSRR